MLVISPGHYNTTVIKVVITGENLMNVAIGILQLQCSVSLPLSVPIFVSKSSSRAIAIHESLNVLWVKINFASQKHLECNADLHVLATRK